LQKLPSPEAGAKQKPSNPAEVDDEDDPFAKILAEQEQDLKEFEAKNREFLEERKKRIDVSVSTPQSQFSTSLGQDESLDALVRELQDNPVFKGDI